MCKSPKTIVVVVVLCLISCGRADAVTLLSTDFTGRTVAGNTASNITWITNGLGDAGNMTAVDVNSTGSLAGLFDTANAQGHFAPDLNTGNEGPWSTSIALIPTGSGATIQSVDLDWQHFNNSGNFQGPNRSVDWTASIIGSSSGTVASVTNLNVNGTSGLETLTFGAPVAINNSESWSLDILATGSNATGNNTGLDAISIDGTAISGGGGPVVFIDDHFDNGDLATGGINGGFQLQSNGAAGTPPAPTESGTTVSLITQGANDNSGIVSLTSVDVAGQAAGVKMTFVVESLSAQPANNGMFLGLQDNGNTFFRDEPNFGLVFDGNESRTLSNNGFALMFNDIGGGGALGNGAVLDHGDIQPGSITGGFIAEIVATPDGWSYLITGLNDPSGTPTDFSNSGTWVGSGLAADFYTTFFDNSEFLAGWVQRGGGGGSITTVFDRFTIEQAGGAPIPEPATAMLALFSAAGLIARRRRAA